MSSERLSITGIHHLPSRRMALADWAERLAELVKRKTQSERPPPPEEDDAETLDLEPEPVSLF